MKLSAQFVDRRGTDTCPAPGSDQFFRKRRSSKRIIEILGIKQHYPLHNFQLSKQLKKGRSVMPESHPIYHGILRRSHHQHHQHHKPDQVTILLQLSPPGPRTDQRNAILLNLHQSIPTSHTIVDNVRSPKSLVITFKLAPRSAKLSMLSTTGFNLA